MKTQVLKISILLIAFFSTVFVNGQTNNRFYKTMDDFKNNTPIAGYEIEGDSWQYVIGGGESIMIIKDGKRVKTKVTKLPSNLFFYNNTLMRVVGKSTYLVLTEGPLCYYASKLNNEEQYYSKTINGELINFKKSTFKKLLIEYNLYDQYKKDKPKREFEDSPNSYFNKLVARNIKYFDLINEKLKNKKK